MKVFREAEGIVNSLLVYSIQLKREINLDLAQTYCPQSCTLR